MTAWAPIEGAGSDFRMRADDGAGIDRDPVLQPRRGWTKEPGEMPVAAKEDSGRMADGNSSARTCAKTR